jgi:hypothetical protein
MNTKLYIGFLASSLLAVAALEGCGGDTTSGSGGESSTSSTSSGATGTGGGTTTPAAPALGVQIDRFGRPAINTALNHAFDAVESSAGTAKDAYNADADATKWAATYTAEFAGNLALLDGLDTKCGNQTAAGAMPVAGRYDALAGVLADDRVWVNTTATACTTYLAVEANFLGMTNTDCGGRKLDYDVIDASYTALATGGASAVGDGVAADADTKGTAFPYLANPH